MRGQFRRIGILNESGNLSQSTIPFIAVAEIAHTESEKQLGCRVTTLSLYGCYVEMSNTLLIGREVAIKIFAESECFAATAKVIYQQSSSGMGLAFEEVSLKSGALLRQSLLKSNGGPQRL